MAVVALDGVVKEFTVARRAGRFRRERSVVRAVDEVSLSIEAGEMVGYIGPNGAGKSTTVKLCTGVLVPTAGRVAVVAADPTRSRTDVVRRIGVVSGQRTQPPRGHHRGRHQAALRGRAGARGRPRGTPPATGGARSPCRPHRRTATVAAVLGGPDGSRRPRPRGGSGPGPRHLGRGDPDRGHRAADLRGGPR